MKKGRHLQIPSVYIGAALLLTVCCSLCYSPQISLAQSNAGDIAKYTLNNSFVSETGVTKVALAPAISSIVTIILGLLGIIFFILAVYAGYIWTTAQGDEGKIEEAKQTIIRASLGFVVVISSYALSAFVTNWFDQNAATSPSDPNSTTLPIGCCLDRVSHTGRPGPSGFGEWTDRMATEYECSTAGNDPNDPGDVRYGDGTWEWIGTITTDMENYADLCEAARRAK